MFTKRILRLVKSVISHPSEKIIYHLSGLVRRNPNVWIFGAQKKIFSCNPKYLFLEASRCRHLGITCVWITRNRALCDKLKERGLHAEYLFSFRGIKYCLTGGFYFVNCELRDISFSLSKGAVVTNLWHGIPLKKIQLDNDRHAKNQWRLSCQTKGGWFDRVFNPVDVRKFDYILSTSDHVTEYAFRSAFNVTADRCLSLGYPRTDMFFKDMDGVMAHILEYEGRDALNVANWLRRFDKRIVYMPTWRDTKDDFVKQSNIDFNDLNQQLEARNACLVIKLHPNTKLQLNFFDRLQNIMVVGHRVDIYPLLPLTDTLITDYSSIYFDYLILGKSIIFFCPDYDKYISSCRDLYLDYEAATPGPKVRTYAELRGALFEDGIQMDWREEREKVRQVFWGAYQGDASLKLIEFISKLRH